MEDVRASTIELMQDEDSKRPQCFDKLTSKLRGGSSQSNEMSRSFRSVCDWLEGEVLENLGFFVGCVA